MIKKVTSFSLGEFIKSRLNTFLITRLSQIAGNHIKSGEANIAALTFDNIGHTISVEGMYEKTELTLIAEWLKKNDLVKGAAIDAGANIGNHSIFFSKIYARVLSFEPNPLTLKLLRFNVELFTKNVEIFPLGLADKEGAFYLALSNKTNIGSAYLVEDELENDGDVIKVEVNSIDNILTPNYETIGLIKIDVEGLELEVLSGVVKLIDRDKPVILFEQQKEDFVNGTSSVIDFLKTKGYRFFTILHTPERGANLSKATRIFGWIKGIVAGSKCEIVECQNFDAGFYSMIIAVNK